MEFLGAGFGDAFISVLAIIGIILVGGFLIFFLGDLVLSVLDPEYVHFWQRKKNGEKVKDKQASKEKDAEQEETKELEFKFDEADKDAFAKEDEEPKAEIAPVEEVKEEPVAEVVEEVKEEEPAKEEPAEEVDELKAEEELFKQNMLKEIEERRQKQAEESDDKFENFFYDDEDIAVFGDEDQANEEQEAPAEEAEAVAEETQEEAPAAEGTTEETVEETEEAEAQPSIEELRAQFEAEIAKLQARNEELESELNSKEEVNTPAGNIEEYEARLETLKDRLAANEKELRKVKKEYIPLRKVSKTLESDERKLRRKEAIVAKQKVVLYGVNNIADIDEEKAKKLSEELDLLEGLKLSVQHCEEVMTANKDRYPILENTFNILTANNETLKADIKETEDAIEALKAAQEQEERVEAEEVVEEVIEEPATEVKPETDTTTDAQ